MNDVADSEGIVATERTGPVLQVVVYDGLERADIAHSLSTQGFHARAVPSAPAGVYTMAVGLVLHRTMMAGTREEKVETLRALGRALRTWSPEAADALESWDGRRL